MNVRQSRLEQQTTSKSVTAHMSAFVSTTSHHFFYLSVFIIIIVHTDCLVVNRPADEAMLLLLLLATLHTSSVERNEPSGTTAAWLPYKRVCALPSPHTFFDFYDVIFFCQKKKKSDFVCSQHGTELTLVLVCFLLSWFVFKYHFEWQHCHM